MKDIAIYGAGGFGREMACLLKRVNNEANGDWNLIGFFDDDPPKEGKTEYGEILGDIETLNTWDKPLSIVFAIGSPSVVALLHSKITNPNVDFPNIISPDTLFLDKESVRMGVGNVFCSRCLISCNIEIGNFNTFNGYITVGHDTFIGSYNSIMPAVNISGGVKIGQRNLIGVSSVILQYKTIGNDTTIGAGAVVLRNTKDGNTYVGNPATKVKY